MIEESRGQSAAAESIPALESTIREPPQGFLNVLRNIGPGIVVTGSVIGSGELINTPKRAAEYGFAILWAVILACVIKYWLQVELGRYCLANNLTTIQALNTLPGPKIRRTHIIPFLYMFGYTLSMATLAGILTATAGLLHDVFRDGVGLDLGVRVWAFICYAVTVFILYRGIYSTLEVFITLLVACFSFSVLFSLLLIQFTNYHMTFGKVAEGLRFSIPPGAGYVIISLMGALGTTANEMFMYPYWILENGYARFVGNKPAAPQPSAGIRIASEPPAPATEAWTRRALGWVHVMKVDAACATTLATVVTLGYYLTAASVLHGRDIGGLDVVKKISRVFTQTYGEWSYAVFMLGGFCTLYSTLVVVAAATGRMGADIASSLGFIAWDNERQRTGVIRAFTIGFLSVWLLMSMVIQHPEKFIIFGQAVNGIFNTPLLLIGIVAMSFRNDKRLRMGPVAACLLLSSAAAIAVFLGVSTLKDLGLLR